jgi:predicted PurR-regulated permease PerM
MTDGPGERRVEEPGPSEVSDPLIRQELRRASVWIGLALAVVLAAFLVQPLLLIVGGMVFASMLDGGARLLGRTLPLPRGVRVAIVAISAIGFIIGVFWFAGVELIGQFEALKAVIGTQIERMTAWATSLGLMPAGNHAEALGRQLMSSLGQLTSAVGTAIGAISSLAMIVVLGLFIALEPRIYERGIAWLLPMNQREGFYETTEVMAWTLRRLMFGRLVGMAVEGVLVWILLTIAGVPMAGLLGLITGLLAFLPNIGAIVSGVLTILVGFSVGTDTGLRAVAVYFAIQAFDGYVVLPIVARRSVDLAPALVLGAQILFGALFGILGLALADPMVAMSKVALERRAKAA